MHTDFISKYWPFGRERLLFTIFKDSGSGRNKPDLFHKQCIQWPDRVLIMLRLIVCLLAV